MNFTLTISWIIHYLDVPRGTLKWKTSGRINYKSSFKFCKSGFNWEDEWRHYSGEIVLTFMRWSLTLLAQINNDCMRDIVALFLEYLILPFHALDDLHHISTIQSYLSYTFIVNLICNKSELMLWHTTFINKRYWLLFITLIVNFTIVQSIFYSF